MDNPYQAHVLNHYSNPHHKRKLTDPPIYSGHAVSTVCGDEVTIEAKIQTDGLITELGWQGEGCCFSQSAASMLAQHIVNRFIQDVHQFTDAEMLMLFQADFPRARAGCILVAVKALRNLWENYNA